MLILRSLGFSCSDPSDSHACHGLCGCRSLQTIANCSIDGCCRLCSTGSLMIRCLWSRVLGRSVGKSTLLRQVVEPEQHFLILTIRPLATR